MPERRRHPALRPANGYGKPSRTEDYHPEARRSRHHHHQDHERNGDVVGVKQVTDDDDLMLITETA